MQNQNTLICLAAQTTTQWVTMDQKSSQASHSKFETSKKMEKKHSWNASMKTISRQLQAVKVEKL